MSQKLILVQGAPGSGKSTLAKKLALDLHLPLVMKDELKESVYDQVLAGTGQEITRDMAEQLGKKIIALSYGLVDILLAQGMSCIFENAFYTEFAKADVEEMLVRYPNVQCLELYCTVGEQERIRRFKERITSGARHAVHANGDALKTDSPAGVADRYVSLGIGQTTVVDTAHFDEAAYVQLRKAVQRRLEEN